MKEKEEGVIRLEETSKAVMEEVLGYLYTGHVDVTENNAFDLLEMADFFVIPSLKEDSSKFISQALYSSNCLVSYYSAERYHCPELQERARDFAFANFMTLTESKDFPNLNTQQVEEWISSSEIKVKEEEDVFQVIVKWSGWKETAVKKMNDFSSCFVTFVLSICHAILCSMSFCTILW